MNCAPIWGVAPPQGERRDVSPPVGELSTADRHAHLTESETTKPRRGQPEFSISHFVSLRFVSPLGFSVGREVRIRRRTRIEPTDGLTSRRSPYSADTVV